MKFDNIMVIGYGVMGQMLERKIRYIYQDSYISWADKTHTKEHYTNHFKNNKGTHLVIIAVPISEVQGIIETLVEVNPQNTYVTDIASVKDEYYDWADSFVRPSDCDMQYVSVHPMVGPLAKNWMDKWEKPYKCIVIQESLRRKAKVERGNNTEPILAFWESLGFELSAMRPDDHDRVIGILSHLSHWLVMEYVGFVEKKVSSEHLELAGPSFAHFKELAEGAKRLSDIYESNFSLNGIVEDFKNYLSGPNR